MYVLYHILQKILGDVKVTPHTQNVFASPQAWQSTDLLKVTLDCFVCGLAKTTEINWYLDSVKGYTLKVNGYIV